LLYFGRKKNTNNAAECKDSFHFGKTVTTEQTGFSCAGRGGNILVMAFDLALLHPYVQPNSLTSETQRNAKKSRN